MSDLKQIILPIDLCLDNDQWSVRWSWGGQDYQVNIDATSDDVLRANIFGRAIVMAWLTAGVMMSAQHGVPLEVLAQPEVLNGWLTARAESAAEQVRLAADRMAEREAEPWPHSEGQAIAAATEVDPEALHDHVGEQFD